MLEKAVWDCCGYDNWIFAVLGGAVGEIGQFADHTKPSPFEPDGRWHGFSYSIRQFSDHLPINMIIGFYPSFGRTRGWAKGPDCIVPVCGVLSGCVTVKINRLGWLVVVDEDLEHRRIGLTAYGHPILPEDMCSVRVF